MKRKTAALASLCLNGLIVALELVAAVLSWNTHGAGMFRFYTEDSNLLALGACAVTAVCQAGSLRSGRPLPGWARRLKYAAVCCLTETFVVVVLILAPLYGGVKGYGAMLLSGSMLYHHLLCPILAFVSLTVLEREPPLPKRAILDALVPTLLYAAVTIALNLARVIDGPYPFLRVYEQPVYMSAVWFLLVVGGAALLAWLVWRLDRAPAGRRCGKTSGV